LTIETSEVLTMVVSRVERSMLRQRLAFRYDTGGQQGLESIVKQRSRDPGLLTQL
jgi:hypothetical protein